MVVQRKLSFNTQGRGTLQVTQQVAEVVRESGIATGLCHVFLHHTSASLMLCENADPVVLRDMEEFMSRLVPDGNPIFDHMAEGPDDMPAHVRTVLTGSALSLPVSDRRCDLGTWQGVFLWEHRHQAHRRELTVTVQGD